MVRQKWLVGLRFCSYLLSRNFISYPINYTHTPTIDFFEPKYPHIIKVYFRKNWILFHFRFKIVFFFKNWIGTLQVTLPIYVLQCSRCLSWSLPVWKKTYQKSFSTSSGTRVDIIIFGSLNWMVKNETVNWLTTIKDKISI